MSDSKQTVEPEAYLFRILDRNNDFYGSITEDGTCINKYGETVGYLDLNNYMAGSVDEKLLGKFEDKYLYSAADERIGELDEGRCYLKDGQGCTRVEMKQDGCIYANSGLYLGQFEGFNFKHMKNIALFVLCIDPDFIKDD